MRTVKNALLCLSLIFLAQGCGHYYGKGKGNCGEATCNHKTCSKCSDSKAEPACSNCKDKEAEAPK